MQVVSYHSDYKNQWNQFMTESINGTFLFHRDFMEYHNDRFTDASLMIYHKNELIACVPANKKEDRFYSHQGLTYGGFVFKSAIDQKSINAVITNVISHLDTHYKSAEFRWQPAFYDPNQELVMEVLSELGFHNQSKFNNLHIHLQEDIAISAKKTAGYRNGKFDNLKLEINHDFKPFWNQILIPQLQTRHDASPVHSEPEMELLASRFPKNIKQYLVCNADEILAGVTFFIKDKIVKSQYAAASPKGLKIGALDYLYIEAIKQFKNAGYHYLDLGHVNHPDGTINRGLQRFKEELGGINSTVYRLKNNDEI